MFVYTFYCGGTITWVFGAAQQITTNLNLADFCLKLFIDGSTLVAMIDH